ncbi:MAG: NAD-dependent epimerase/dehydratase family protein [Planctomycetota bacterium]
MFVLITGATGFVGSFVVRELHARGHRVRAFVRDAKRAAALGAFIDNVCVGDLDDGARLAEASSGVDAIIHAAGLTKAVRSSEFNHINIECTKRICEISKKVNPGLAKFVLVSSLAASGPNFDATIPRRESDAPAPVSNYGKSKLGGELAAREVFKDSNVKLIIIRPPIVYGEGDRDLLVAIRQIAKGFIPIVGGAASLQKRYSLVHAEDLARGIVLALESNNSDERCYFLPGPRDATLAGLLDAVESAVGRRARRISVSLQLARPMASICEFAARAFSKPSIINRDKLIEIAAPGWTCSPDAARRDFSYKPQIDFPDGILRQVRWAREEKLL